VIILFVVLVIISATVGFTIGTLKRKSPPLNIETDILSSPLLSETGLPPLLMPHPVIPHRSDQFVEYSFYLEDHEDDLDKIHMIPVKISDLLKYRSIGEPVNIKPFQFQNRELDIIINKNELAEP
jgi:hypothetical protein